MQPRRARVLLGVYMLDSEFGIDWPIPVEASNTDLISRKDASANTQETLGQAAIQST